MCCILGKSWCFKTNNVESVCVFTFDRQSDFYFISAEIKWFKINVVKSRWVTFVCVFRSSGQQTTTRFRSSCSTTWKILCERSSSRTFIKTRLHLQFISIVSHHHNHHMCSLAAELQSCSWKPHHTIEHHMTKNWHDNINEFVYMCGVWFDLLCSSVPHLSVLKGEHDLGFTAGSGATGRNEQPAVSLLDLLITQHVSPSEESFRLKIYWLHFHFQSSTCCIVLLKKKRPFQM